MSFWLKRTTGNLWSISMPFTLVLFLILLACIGVAVLLANL